MHICNLSTLLGQIPESQVQSQPYQLNNLTRPCLQIKKQKKEVERDWGYNSVQRLSVQFSVQVKEKTEKNLRTEGCKSTGLE